MIKIGDEKFYPPPPLAKTQFISKKGVKNPKISPKLNQVRLSPNFQGSWGQENDQGWWWKILPLL